MKTNNLMYVLVGAFMISSCSDNVEGVNGSNENQTGSTEYTASAGFDWATSRNVSVSVSSPKTTVRIDRNYSSFYLFGQGLQ